MAAIQLKKILAALKVPQAELARFCNVSAATVAQLCNHGIWPSEKFAGSLKANIEKFLAGKKILPGVIATAFEVALPGGYLIEPNHNESDPSQEDNDMLLRKQIFTPVAKNVFGLPRNPFGELQCKDDMWISSELRYVREHMYTTAKIGGITAIVGESGAGKSSLRRDFEQRIVDEREPIILAQPYMIAAEDNDVKGKTVKSTHIARSILRAIAPLAKPKINSDDRFDQLHRELVNQFKAGTKVCVVIEEAHSLNLHTLKHLKRLYELEIGYTKLLSIILIGQPELKLKLDERNPDIRELVQRCELVELRPIAVAELEQFIDHRMKRVGKSAADIIDQSGITALADRLVSNLGESQLYPLLVGNFLVAAMNDAAKIGIDIIDADIVKEVA